MALKASPNDQAKLLEVQALDNLIQQLEHRAKSLPQLAKLSALEGESNLLRVDLLSASGAVEDAERELARIESDVALVQARIARDTERLQTSSSVKDVTGLESEIATLSRRQNELEEIELVLMERVEELNADHRALQAKNEESLSVGAEIITERDQLLGEMARERNESAANRAKLASGLPEDLMALYERQRARYGQGASMLRGGVSAASGVKLNESDLAAIRSAFPDEIMLCPDSSAILVRTGESGL